MKRLFIISLILILTATAFGQMPQIKPMLGVPINKLHPLGDPVGFWYMPEGSGNKVFDLSGNGNTGTFVSAVSWIAGSYGSALSFAGSSDYIDCGNKSSVNITDAITVVLRCRFDVIGSNTWLFGKYSTGDDQRQYQIVKLGDNKVNFSLGSSDGTGFTSTTGSKVLSANIWYIVVALWEGIGKPLRIFIDGIELSYDTQDTKNDSIKATSTNNLLIGARNDQLSSSMRGDIEYTYVYNRALSASEIALLYREPFGMFQQDNIALLAVEAPAPTGGQVIMIQMSAIPIIFIVGLCLMIGRKNGQRTADKV